MKTRKLFNQPQTQKKPKDQQVSPTQSPPTRAELSVLIKQVIGKTEKNPEKAAKILTLWIQSAERRKSA